MNDFFNGTSEDLQRHMAQIEDALEEILCTVQCFISGTVAR